VQVCHLNEALPRPPFVIYDFDTTELILFGEDVVSGRSDCSTVLSWHGNSPCKAVSVMQLSHSSPCKQVWRWTVFRHFRQRVVSSPGSNASSQTTQNSRSSAASALAEAGKSDGPWVSLASGAAFECPGIASECVCMYVRIFVRGCVHMWVYICLCGVKIMLCVWTEKLVHSKIPSETVLLRVPLSTTFQSCVRCCVH